MAVYTSAARTWSNPSSDATLREYLQAINTGLNAVGMPRTTDSGQFDLDTVAFASLPTTATETMYDVRYLNDGLKTTSPILIKSFYWLSGGLLRVGFRAGVQTNDSGVFTSPSERQTGAGAAYGGTTPLNATGGEGYAGYWIPGVEYAGWYLTRTAGADGSPNSDGFVVYYSTGTDIATVERQALIQTVVLRASEASYTLVPQGRLASLNPGQALDVYRHYTAMPEPRVNPFAATVHGGEHSAGISFTADPIQGQVHSFVPIMDWDGADSGGFGSARNNVLAVRWEQ